MNKILTVVIPTYNMEKYLRKCLDSLVIEDKELFNLLEVLVIIDGGKDSSSAIAHEYQDKYPDVFRVIDKENGNYGSCVNRGLKEAIGKYFKILDADDCYSKEGLSELLKYLVDSDIDLCVTSYSTVDEDGNKISDILVPDQLHNSISNIDGLSWEEHFPRLLLSMHAFCVKRSVLIDNNYKQQEGISYTDTEFNYFSLLYSRQVVFLNYKVYNYLLGREGQTMSAAAAAKNSNNYYKVGRRLMEDFTTQEMAANKRKTLFIPVNNVVSSFFYTELFVKNTSIVNKEELHELVKLCGKCGVDTSIFKFHSLRYVDIYKECGLTFHWLYVLYNCCKKLMKNR